MWINSPLGQWEMKEHTKRMHRWQDVGRWRREVEDARKVQARPRSTSVLMRIVLALGDWFGLDVARRAA